MHNEQHALRKAAILVASLDTQSADELLERISEEQAGRVRRMMVQLGDVDPEEQNEVIGEFFRITPLVPVGQPPGIELDGGVARRLRQVTVPSKPAEPVALGAAPFRFLHEASGEKLTPLLEGEHPQTIALVVSHLLPDRAAGVLATLSETLQVDVLRRLVDLEETDPEILREVEQGLKSRIDGEFLAQHRRTAGLAAVERILQAAGPGVKDTLLTNLRLHDQQLADRLASTTTNPRFAFEDLNFSGDATLLTVFQAADPQLVILALAGASTALAQRIEGLLPSHDAKPLRRNMQNLGPTRLSDVEQAQQEIVRVARRLQSEGRINLHLARSARVSDPSDAPTVGLPDLRETCGPGRGAVGRPHYSASAFVHRSQVR